MRAAVAALLAVFVLAGCGGASKSPGNLRVDAAELVPPDAIAFASFDTDLNSEEWRRVMAVWPIALPIGKLDFERDVRPAVGNQLDLAILDVEDGAAESLVWLMQPKDATKLRRVVDVAFGPGHLIEKVGGRWVVAPSQSELVRVRAAHSGRSLADVDWFNKANAGLSGDAVAAGYAYGEGLGQLGDEVAALTRVLGSPRWVAAQIGVEDDAVRAQVHAALPHPELAVYRPRLLRDVPSGAVLAISFKDARRLLRRIDAEPSLRTALGDYRSLLTDIEPALQGEGVFFVTPGLLLPTIALEVETPTPADTSAALRKVRQRIEAETNGALKLHVLGHGRRVLLTNALVTGGPPFPPRGGRLVDDQPFKDAFAAADAPAEVTWLAYADLPRLLPIVQTLSQLLGGEPPSSEERRRLGRLGSLVAFGARSGSTSRLELRLTGR